jgi:CspA family cold shock protein
MQTGTIKSLNKGFGFLRIEGRDKDLFFHANDLTNVAFDDLREGDTMSFEISEGPKGPNAINVSKV